MQKAVIIIPTYNERENIISLIPQIFSVVPDINIMVVDDNSPDKTADAVRELAKIYPHLSVVVRPEKNGLGGAYLDGFQRVLKDPSIDNIIMMDADFQHDPQYLPELLENGKKYDLVFGSRYADGGGVLSWPLKRKLLSLCSMSYYRILLGKGIKDWSSGFNCIKTNALRRVNFDSIQLVGHEFIIGLKFNLLSSGSNFKEIPVLLPGRREGESKVTIKSIFRGLVIPWKLIKLIN